MCDCYVSNCANCDCEISLHIADFCTPRENVIPYCHRCTRKIVRGKLTPPDELVFNDMANEVSKGAIQGIKPGDSVKIYSKDPNAYGIHLN